MLPTDGVTRAGDCACQAGTAGADIPSSSPEAAPRVVLDTNTVLDWLVFEDPPSCELGAAITAGQLTWLATPHMLAELRAVLCRPLAAKWNAAREHALTIDVSRWTVPCAEPAAAAPLLVCRDPDDQVFIDLARAQSPAVLLTRDRALLALRRRAATFGVLITTAGAWRPPALRGAPETRIA
jgi:putative PIN family toxin of toxin-antitoxin system